MAEVEKIGTVAWYPVRRHSRILYIRLKDEDVGIYGFKPGDRLKVEIQAIQRGIPEEEHGRND